MSDKELKELQKYNLEYLEARNSEEIFGGDYTSAVELKYAKKEIERLNNIIDNLEKELEERYLDFKDSECEEVRTTAYEDISILKRIKELKGDDKE